MTTPSLDLSLFGDNLAALSAIAAGYSDCYVFDFSGSKLVPIWAFDGRMFKIIQDIGGGCCFSDGSYATKLQRVILSVRDSFSLFLDSLDTLEADLQASLKENPSISKSLTGPERQILSIGATCTFLATHQMLFNPRASLEGLQELYREKTGAILLTDAQVLKLERFTRRYCMACFVAMLEVHYPIAAFKKLIENQALEREEIEILNEWVEAVEEHKEAMSLSLVHSALVGIVESFDLVLKDKTLQESVSYLEWKLFQGGCRFFGEDDERHREWTEEAIRPGARLALSSSTGARSLRIGRRISMPLVDEFHASLFELPDDPTSLIFVGRNPAILGMWLSNCDACARACRPVQVLEKDPFLRYFVVERVHMTLSDITWKTRGLKIDPLDTPFLEQVANFAAWLTCNTLHTPKNLRPDRLFVLIDAHSVRLRTILPFDDPGPHDFYAIEQFIHQCAKGNRYVRRFLMHESLLTNHDSAHLISDVVKKSVLGIYPDLTVQNMLNREKIHEYLVIQKIEALVHELKSCREKVVSHLTPKLINNRQVEKLRDRAIDALLAHQKDMGYITSIDPWLQEAEGLAAFVATFLKHNQDLFQLA